MASFAYLGERTGFPDPNETSADGLVAVSQRLTTERLIAAYERGIFPWFDSDDSPVLWWCPDPRAVLHFDAIRITRSLKKRIRNGGFEVTLDTAFDAVVDACAEPRVDHGVVDTMAADDFSDSHSGTWITEEMAWHYGRLHRLGIAHSVETWLDGELVGGLYGVSLGRMFFGESMFSRTSDASKVALVRLAGTLDAWGFRLIDRQIMNPHLASLGATLMPRRDFLSLVAANANETTRQGLWQFDG